jgi:predicted Zn finger-like uncharacterized protein
MKITCPKCKTRLTLPDEKLKPEGTKFRCSKCRTSLFYKGKGQRGPQDDISELSLPPLQTVPEPQTMPHPAVSAAEAQVPDEGGSSVDSADSGDIRSADALAGGGKIIENQENPEERETAPAISRQYAAPVTYEGRRIITRKAVLTGAAAGILFLCLIAISVFYMRDDTTRDQVPAPGADKGIAASAVPAPANGQVPQASPAGAPAVPAQEGTAAEQPSAPINEEKAIEIVKRSEALLKRTSVESIVRKWTYLVSFTALEGDAPKGFYFELDVQSGTVQSLSQNPELQKKYNIH